MSIDSAKAFLERMKTDEEFRQRITEAETVEARTAICKSEGFEFTKEDIDSLKNELSDELLEQVAGGVGGTCWPPGTQENPPCG